MVWPSVNNVVQVLRLGFELFPDVSADSIQKLLCLILAAPLETLL